MRQVLVGQWERVGAILRADAVAVRIKELTDTCLTKIAVAESGWETLYRDPADVRLWELSHPHSEMHGSGPPKLRCLPIVEAQAKYAFSGSNQHTAVAKSPLHAI
jgi:hypothetical protein